MNVRIDEEEKIEWVQTTIRVPKATLPEWRKAAIDRGISMSEMIRISVSDYLAKTPTK
tara:strand:+ start:9 stop:182 length:174 start_codon:yes stop_codon:yes gene_type:complete